MRHSTAAIDRVLTALLGLALVLGGGSLLLWRAEVHLAQRLYQHADRTWYLSAAQQQWWNWALAGMTLGALVCGGCLMAANLRPNRMNVVELPTGGDEVDTAELNAGALATAVAGVMSKHPAVRSATGRAVVDRGLRTIRIIVVADPDLPLDQLRRLAADSVADVDAATDHADIATQFLVRLTKPS